METVKPDSGYNPIRPFKAAWLILGLALAVAVGLAGWFYLNQNKKVAVPPVPKTASPSLQIASPFEGTVVSASSTAVVVKGASETKTFTLSNKLVVQKQASSSAVGKMTALDTATIAAVKPGTQVLLTLNKTTGQVVSIVILPLTQQPTVPVAQTHAYLISGVLTSVGVGNISVAIGGKTTKTVSVSDKTTIQKITFDSSTHKSNSSQTIKLTDLQIGDKLQISVDKNAAQALSITVIITK